MSTHSVNGSRPMTNKQALSLCVIAFFTLWQTPVAFLGVILFLLLIRLLRLEWWTLLAVGLPVACVATFMQLHYTQGTLRDFFANGFSFNIEFWKHLLTGSTHSTLYFLYENAFNYVMGFSLLLAGLLGAIDLIPNSAHEKALKSLHQGQNHPRAEMGNKRLDSALVSLSNHDPVGTVLGLSKLTGKPVIVPDYFINQILLVLGTTGGGKTITLRRFYQRAAYQHYPLIVVDGKPTDENVEWLSGLAQQTGRRFYGFNCRLYDHYDPLAHGGYTELKDKLISLKDEWESDYYRSIAEDYLQTTFEVLQKSGQSYDLKTIVECLDYENLAVLVRQINDEQLTTRVRRLEQYNRKDIIGLQAHLNLLIHSELGQFFEKTDKTFNLLDVIQQNAIVYFALPALRFPSFSKVLGKLIINDIKAIVDRQTQAKPIFAVFDEFSVFAGEQVLNLVNMGRGKGVHAIFGTQGLADLQKIDQAFANQVLNCVNTILCHRLNDQDSAEAISSWVGTRDSFDLTAQISSEQGSTGMGSVRRNKEFIVHPDAIKQDLQPGEAFYITKVGQFRQDKIKVKYS